MAQQRAAYPLEFNGPFLGLNTAQAPHALGPGFATVAENVIIDRGGSVRPREPWANYQQQTVDGDGHSIFNGIQKICVGMLHIDLSKLAGLAPSTTPKIRILAKTFGGRVKEVAAFGDLQEQFVQVADALSSLAPTWVLVNRRLYVIDGSSRMIVYDGDTSRLIGITPPTATIEDEYPPDPLGEAQLAFIHVSTSPGPGAGTYIYGATFYDSVNGVESNPVIPWTSVEHTDATRVRIQLYPFRFLTNEGIDRVRVYRQRIFDANDEAVAEPSRLIGEAFGWGETNPTYEWDGDVPDDAVTLSDEASGPFLPTRNGLPPSARIAVWYKARMWYADPDDGTRLWYSEAGIPEHVGSLSFLPLGGDADDQIAGMVEMAGQLVILKKDGLWILTGNLETHTNSSVALGQVPGVDFVESFPEIYKTKSKTGCHNTGGGNGAIVCGHPPMLYYSNANGLYRFDGADDRPVSDLIDAEWRDMLKADVSALETDHAISYAIDTANQVLYVTSTQFGATGFSTRILAYHWGLNRGDGIGLWTTLSSGSKFFVEQPPAAPFLGIGCIATALGRTSSLGVPNERVQDVSPLLIAETFEHPVPEIPFVTRFFIADPDTADQIAPAWRWRTGDLALASDNRTHLYRMKYRHEKYAGDNPPLVRVSYSLDGESDFILLGTQPDNMQASIVHSHRLGTKGRTIALDFTRAHPTDVYDAWRGLTGFSIDYELAEQR